MRLVEMARPGRLLLWGALGGLFLMLLAPVLLARVARAANPNALWEIVDGKCVPNEEAHGSPAPCAEVVLPHGAEGGFAVLKDLVGQTQYLLIATARTSGIESPALLQPGAPNYFADAWQAQSFVDAKLDRTLPREDISLAINSVDGRTQNQLHIHVDCIRADVRDALEKQQSAIGTAWSPYPQALAGHYYLAMRVPGEALTLNPFQLVADGIPGARESMGKHTIFVTGANFAGKPGFVLLEDSVDLAKGDRGSAEELQDHQCGIAGH
jgi:CDP-diacylglycerol pyrophosphatase